MNSASDVHITFKYRNACETSLCAGTNVSVVIEVGNDLLVKASMRSLVLGTAHTAKFSPSPLLTEFV